MILDINHAISHVTPQRMTPINTWPKKVDKTLVPSTPSSIFFLHTPAAICMRGYFPVGKGLDGKRSLLLSLRIRHPHPLCTDFDLFLSRLRR
ncbi:hypothetical protein CEXT_97841 [Caerostris extrusa]|uniref:Uncharacterized protein n=1 Tax=Caerostris extrusa TaxID=172846 RepID=A0AAV4XL17_CAEEX|nr:hypothetical protein CEXT_97841 [Caerostris extrusa]